MLALNLRIDDKIVITDGRTSEIVLTIFPGGKVPVNNTKLLFEAPRYIEIVRGNAIVKNPK